MDADADIQVWLETLAGTQPTITTPYVQSSDSGPLHYEIRVLSDSPSGRTAIRQSNTLVVDADTPAALGQLSLSHDADGACDITIIIRRDQPSTEKIEKYYEFPCTK